MRLPAVHVGHPEVEVVQTTWHALLRFRQRHFREEPGTEAAIAALVACLERAEITTRPPGGVGRGGAGDWELWAVCDRLAFPLSRAPGGGWVATTCLPAR
jgi:hypothetical protein